MDKVTVARGRLQAVAADMLRLLEMPGARMTRRPVPSLGLEFGLIRYERERVLSVRSVAGFPAEETLAAIGEAFGVPVGAEWGRQRIVEQGDCVVQVEWIEELAVAA